MVSYSEKERLLRAFRNEPAYGLGVVFKCAAGLLILVGLAVIGTTAEPPSQSSATASARSASMQAQQGDPAAGSGPTHAKAIERRSTAAGEDGDMVATQNGLAR